MDDIKEFLGFLSLFIMAMFGVILGILILLFIIFISFNGISYNLDKSMCSAYVNNENVYSGRCHFLSVHSIGENGNTKQLTIYKDVYGLKPLKKYVANDIEIKESEEN